MERVHELLQAYRRMLVDAFGSRLIELRLFGSRAHGDADPASDVDVAVIIDAMTEQERTQAVELAFAAWRTVGAEPLLSPLVWSRQEYADRLNAERSIAIDIAERGIPT